MLWTTRDSVVPWSRHGGARDNKRFPPHHHRPRPPAWGGTHYEPENKAGKGGSPKSCDFPFSGGTRPHCRKLRGDCWGSKYPNLSPPFLNPCSSPDFWTQPQVGSHGSSLIWSIVSRSTQLVREGKVHLEGKWKMSSPGTLSGKGDGLTGSCETNTCGNQKCRHNA